MGTELNHDQSSQILLELAASDDLQSFKSALHNSGLPIDQVGLWYTRRIGSPAMSYELRTPLMVAALYGSAKVVDYILRSGLADVNRVSGSDSVTALHCAVAGGSPSSLSIVNGLISSGAAVDPRATELIPRSFPKKQLETLLSKTEEIPDSLRPISPSERQRLPDINNSVYSSDEFRMYCFKIKPCSRAYTHDWTECPFAHPGENARRRDPTKHHYTCVPCPDFKKGSCKKSDDCEFAHGVFESWLHPAQYRTRLCKDETGCIRKVCFFAHRKEELRPVYHSTGSALPCPDVGMTSLGLSTPPLSPSMSPQNSGGAWQGKVSPPSLQLSGSRLRSSLSARDVEFGRELKKIESQLNQFYHQHQNQSQILSPGLPWDLNPANLESVYGSMNVPKMVSDSSPPKFVAAAMFAQRSQSFVDRAVGGYGGAPANVAEWGSPEGTADWGVQGDELSKLRKWNSFGFRGNGRDIPVRKSPAMVGEPDVAWVNSLVKEELRSPWVGQLYREQEQLVA